MSDRDQIVLELRAEGLGIREIALRVGLSQTGVWLILDKNGLVIRQTPLERFLSKVDKNGAVPSHHPELGACWTWLGAIGVRGYGQFQHDGKSRSAQAASYILFVGPVPEGLVVDHVCHNGSGCAGGTTCIHRRCVNPAHLEAVTAQENIQRGCWPANRFKTHCPQGHPYSGDNLYVVPSGGRSCRACGRARAQRRWQEQKAAA